MKQSVRKIAVCLCVAFLFSITGCFQNPFDTIKKQFLLDGPGMENTPKWTVMDISRSSTFANDIFSFAVTDVDGAMYLTGECRGSDGTHYMDYDGILLSGETYSLLRKMNLDELEDVPPDDGEDHFDDGAFLLDGDSHELILTYSDGKRVKKAISSEEVAEIFDLLAPCFGN